MDGAGVHAPLNREHPHTMTDRPIITTPGPAPVSSDTDSIRRGGLRRLRAGLPLEVSTDEEPARNATRSLQQFTSDVERAIQDDTTKERTALLVRANHRAIPSSTGLGRWQLHPELELRLSALHPDLLAIGLGAGEILLFVPGLRRRDDGEQLLVKFSTHSPPTSR